MSRQCASCNFSDANTADVVLAFITSVRLLFHFIVLYGKVRAATRQPAEFGLCPSRNGDEFVYFIKYRKKQGILKSIPPV